MKTPLEKKGRELDKFMQIVAFTYKTQPTSKLNF